MTRDFARFSTSASNTVPPLVPYYSETALGLILSFIIVFPPLRPPLIFAGARRSARRIQKGRHGKRHAGLCPPRSGRGHSSLSFCAFWIASTRLLTPSFR